MTVRIETLRKKIEELGYDAYLATNELDVYYLTGLPVPQAPYLLVKTDGDHVIYVLSDGLNPATKFVGNVCEVKASKAGLHWGAGMPSLALLLEDLPGMNLKRVGFDTLSFADHQRLIEKSKDTAFIPDRGTMWDMRTIKSKEEVEYIRKALKISEEGMKRAVEVIKPGMREYEVAAEAEYTMRKLGSEDEGHRTILTSGSRTVLGVGSGYCTDRIINEGDLVIVDLGSTINGYRSDLARPYIAGKPTSKQQKIYEVVREAWDAGFACVKPGVIAGDVDAAIRNALGEYAKYLDHEVGHGMGLEHEPPALTVGSKDVFKEDMVVSVESAVNIPDFGYMIIEDLAVIRKDGAERLSDFTMEWD